MFGLFIIEAGSEPVALLNGYGNPPKPWVFFDGAQAAEIARDCACGLICHQFGWTPLKVQPRRLSDDAWKARELGRFADGSYTALPWADLPSKPMTADHFPHVSTEDGAKIAYTQDASKGAGDIQTRVKPGKYLQQFYSDVFDAPTIARMAADFGVQYGESLVLQFATTEREIEHVYVNGPSSCMAKPERSFDSDIHPCRIYAAGDLAIAYMERNNAITARVLCWPAKKIFGRIYGDETRILDLLDTAGYSEGKLDGARMLRIKAGRGFVMPYVDGCCSAEDAGTHLILGDGDVCGSNQNGLSASEYQCENCECEIGGDDCRSDDNGNMYCDSCHDEMFGYCEHDGETCDRDGMEEVITTSHRGRRVTQSWGANAIDRCATRCEGNREYHDNDLIVTLADGTSWSQDYFDDYGSVCEGTSELYANEDCIQLEDGTTWSKDYFEDHGVTVDGCNYAKGDEPEADEEDAVEAPQPVVTPKPVVTPITVGAWVECLGSIQGEFTRGKRYLVTRIEGARLGVAEDDSGDDNGWTISEFKLSTQAEEYEVAA